jgi:hypothetical protein
VRGWTMLACRGRCPARSALRWSCWERTGELAWIVNLVGDFGAVQSTTRTCCTCTVFVLDGAGPVLEHLEPQLTMCRQGFSHVGHSSQTAAIDGRHCSGIHVAWLLSRVLDTAESARLSHQGLQQ